MKLPQTTVVPTSYDELKHNQAAILNILADYQDTTFSNVHTRRAILNILTDLDTSNNLLQSKTLQMTETADLLLRKHAVNTAILESIGDGIIVTDSTGNITFVNQAFERLTGWTSDEVVQTNILTVLPTKDTQVCTEGKLRTTIDTILCGDEDISNKYRTHFTLRKDSSLFPINFIITPVKLHGDVIGLVMSFRDITKEISIDKVKTEFVSLASHQLRTPLSAISWYTEMLLAGDVGSLNTEQEKYLHEVYTGNQRMIQLVNSLLNITQMNFGTFMLETEMVEIIPLIHSVLQEQKSDIDKKLLQLATKFTGTIPTIRSDRKLLRMVVQNLLSNAIKYTPEQGDITLSLAVEPNGQHLLFTVADTGCGIPHQQQAKVFSRLFRADNARTSEIEGTGLGLYIVKNIIENSGGRVWFESKENSGSTFYVELPITTP